MSNDPRKNINNLLFKPNNSIDDGQPAFYFYSQPEPTSTTNNANATTANIQQNVAGPNNNPYQLPNVNQSNLFDASLFDNFPGQNITQTQQFPSAPPQSTQTARLFPAERQETKPRGLEPLPSVILFSNTNTVPKTTSIEQAFTISTYSTIGTPANPVVNETAPSVPLLSVNQAKEQQAFFSVPGEAATKTTEIEYANQVPFFNASTLSTTGLVDSFGTPNKPIEAELSVPLYPNTGIIPGQSLLPTNREAPVSAAVPLFSSWEVPVKSTLAPPPPAGSTNTYRRTGSKRPVYAPIPGLQNPYQQPPISHTFGSAGDYFTSSQLVNKPIGQLADSSQENSPFLCPVSISPVLGEGFVQNQSVIMPAIGGSQLPAMSTAMYQNDGKLSPVSVVGPTTIVYKPPNFHWFYKKEIDGKVEWEPFSVNDSLKLENNFTSHDLNPEQNIPTDGGRYDVNILRRQRTSVYWESKPSEVRRCSWFHKNHTDSKRIPFEENVATKLEEEYKLTVESNQWGRKINLPTGETVMFHTHEVLILSSNSQTADLISNNMQDGQFRHRVIKRGIDGYTVDEGESDKIDHLLFMVHGIGAGCDLKFRSVEEVVDDFRSVALQLVRTHYRSSCDQKLVARVEILPIGWHSKLHSEDTGIDNKLKSITLESIPKLREFTNDTLLDILFYTSPIYGQTIISSVGSELNRVYDLFKQRNPNFTGGISLAGHSLGSLILFDILCNQVVPVSPDVEQVSDEENAAKNKGAKSRQLNRKMSRKISYMVGSSGTGQAQVNYPILNFQPTIFFALGSPIGMFVTIRGLDNLGEKFALPTCPGFFNIFHPYDPVAYRIESLINYQLANVKPVLIPHHKGRKRMHLELKETMAKVGSDLKQKLVDSMKNTWNSLLGWSNTRSPVQPAIAEEVDKVLEQFATKHSTQKESDEQSGNREVGDMNLGMLNKGRRIDYVLQEAPVEFFNEYIFALSSHVCYWDSEDTVLMIIKEIYNLSNVSPDSQIPQQTMTIERPPPQSRIPDQFTNQTVQVGIDPTTPIKGDCNIGPPPLSGFVKHS